MKNRTLTRKHLENRYSNASWPKLLVLKDKHESEYYLINDIDALLRAALQILELRIKQRYISEPEKEPYGLKEEVADDLIDKLPEAMREQAKRVKADNARTNMYHLRALEQWTMVQKALAEKDGMAAFQVLDDRKDHEYEGFEFERIKIP